MTKTPKIAKAVGRPVKAKAETDWKREATKYRKGLESLTATVMAYIGALDAVMTRMPSNERDGKVAKLSNDLEFANDQVRYFTLGVDWRTDNKGRN